MCSLSACLWFSAPVNATLGDSLARMAAGVDALIGCQIHINIKRQSMIGEAVPDA